MTAENMKSALAFAVFSFLLVLIATFGVVYRYDLYPEYGTLVQIGPNLYQSPNTVPATMKSQKSTENGVGPEQGRLPPPAIPSESIKNDSSKSDSEFFNKVVAVFSSVKSQPNDPIPAEKSKIKSEKLYEKTAKTSPTARPNVNSFYDRLIEVVNKDIAVKNKNEHQLKGTNSYEIQSPSAARRGKTQVLPPWIQKILQGSSERKIDSLPIPVVFPGLENFLDDLGGDLSSESFEIPEFPFLELLDDTEEYDSDEDFFFNRNPKHFVQPERLPEFPHPVIDFPVNRAIFRL